MASRPPRSALRPGTASRSSTPARTRPPRSRPAPRAGARSTTRSPRWTPAAAPRRRGWKVRYGLMLGLERVLASPTPRRPSGTELRRHQIDALAGMLTELIAANQRQAEENGNGNGNGNARRPSVEAEPTSSRRRTTTRRRASTTTRPRRARVHRRGPGRERRYRFRHPTASGKTIAAAGFVEAARHARHPDPHAPPPARLPVPARPDDRGLRRALHRRDRRGQGAAPRRPDHDPDLRLVRPPRRRDLARAPTSS